MMVKVNLSSHQNNTLEETKSKFYFAFVTKGKQNMTTWDKWCLETPQVVVGGGNKNVALGSSTHPTTPFLPSYCSCCCCPCRSSLSRQSLNTDEPTDLCETCWTPLSPSPSPCSLPPPSLSLAEAAEESNFGSTMCRKIERDNAKHRDYFQWVWSA